MQTLSLLLTNLPFVVCIAIVALAALWLAIALRRSRTSRLDTSDWLPARGTVIQRRENGRNPGQEVTLIIAFSTLDGRRVEFTDVLAAWQVDYSATVPVIYDPDDPTQARVIRRRRGHHG